MNIGAQWGLDSIITELRLSHRNLYGHNTAGRRSNCGVSYDASCLVACPSLQNSSNYFEEIFSCNTSIERNYQLASSNEVTNISNVPEVPKSREVKFVSAAIEEPHSKTVDPERN